MAFKINSEIENNVKIVDNNDGTWNIEFDVLNPQANSYTFYWNWSKDTATKITVTGYYRDIDIQDKIYPRFFKDFTTGDLVLDKINITEDAEGSFTEIVMRNETDIILVIEPDNVDGEDTFGVFIKTNSLLGVGNR